MLKLPDLLNSKKEKTVPIVYVTTNKINGRKYLGKCVHKKPSYLGSGIALKNAVRLYGKNSFSKEIIREVETLEEAADIERSLSIKWNVVDDPLWYNMKTGGDGGSARGLKRSDETKQKISESKKGSVAWNKGLAGTDVVKHREETKRRIGLGNKGVPKLSGANHACAKTAIFTDVNGVEYIAHGIRAFCRENGISESSILWRLMKHSDLPTKTGWKVRYEK